MHHKVLVLAGEESGRLYASRISDMLRSSGVEVRGYGDYGFSTADLAVFGFWPVLRRIFFFLGVARTMKRAIREWRPDVVATVDYPGMNLKLAAYAKRLGIPSVHMVCPQVWACTGTVSRRSPRRCRSFSASSRSNRSCSGVRASPRNS